MICKRCGTVFCVDNREDSYWLSTAGRSLYCSKMCKQKSRPSHQKHKRELRKRPDKIRRQVAILRQRDGDDCWLCLRPIDFTIADPAAPMHYSRDHVMPRSLGGDLAIANMRLAHQKCNTEKGQKLLTADDPACE